MSTIDEYNEMLREAEELQISIQSEQKSVAALQSQRDILRKNKRQTNSSDAKQVYQEEIEAINKQVKELEKDISDLQVKMAGYQQEIRVYEYKISEMYSPVSNTTTVQSSAISQSPSDLTTPGAIMAGAQGASAGTSDGTPYDDINGMADAYEGLNKASDYINALGSEDKGNLFKSIYHSANIFTSKETDLIHNRYRYGVLNAYEAVTNSREFLFFTKPDLNIIPSKTEDGSSNYNDPNVNINGSSINPGSDLNGVLQNYPFWVELVQRYPGVVECLQSSLHLNGVVDPFNHLLANMVQSNIDVPSLSAEMIETPTNTYGVGYNYRGSSEASDDGFDFSLEFKDTRNLQVYNFFKAYEEYETLKHHGVIAPWIGYIYNKVLHDQYSIYKFVVGDDGETLLYYAKYYGVKSKSLPRDVFNANTYDNGLSYSVDFNAAFVEDMNPLILADFNRLSYDYWNSKKNFIDVYDFRYDKVDNRAANAAVIVREINGEKGYQIVGIGEGNRKFYDNIDMYGDGNPKMHTKEPGGFCYKIKWKGDASV